MSDVIKSGKFVSLTYSICDTQGNVLEQNDIPVSYIHGGDMELIGGMDMAVEGKKPGDRVEFSVPPGAAFGKHDQDLVFTDDIGNVPPQFRYLGAEVQMQNDQGDVKSFYVTRIEDDRLTVDGNHPLAGKTLIVSVNVREVRDATKEDVMALSSAGQCSIN
ncbi:MAG: FKBP-type peptidyl-prolyl cis-trans isomerase [Gammaproteobacteria bacterium]|nr:FKBP-type peptidyl-prolyl cis-trans isomerase [Gammaproteobacteria bacterium]MBU1656037.1 FKBP-type peptidyl-prolyl cis-trans isomerase [Gammaproteobacteria bacterium]MBU1962245.1 FKBP-type peptidyl-prolyl cis-trans isomerase [Gammaproteobacteria bacterium]